MTEYTKSATFNPADVIPAATLAEFGEKRMQKEFSALFTKNLHTVDGWTVTAKIISDESDAEFANNRIDEYLASVPAKSLNAFA